METTNTVTNDLRNALLKCINAMPGIRYRELMRLVGVSNGVLTYHLAMLERTDSIKVDRKSRMTRYYAVDIPVEESFIIGYLKNSTARRITIFILEHDLCSFSEIVEYTKKAPSTISWHLKRLRDADMISVYNGEYQLYRVEDKGTITEILSKYKESFVDKVVNNYTEMIEEL
jgi:predicted transcriptional regulator